MTDSKPRLSRVGRAARGILILLVPIAAWSLWDYIEARRLSAVVKEIQSRGEPIVSRAAARPHVYPPPARTAGAYYDAAAILTDRPTLAKIDSALYFGRGDRSAVIAQLKAWLDENRQAEQLLEAGSNAAFAGAKLQDHLRWDRLWTVSSLARARVVERLEAHDGDGAATALIRQIRIARAMEGSWEWLPFTFDRAFADFADVLEERPSAAVLQQLQQAIRARDRDSVIHEDALSSRGLLIESMWNTSSDWYGRPTAAFHGNPIEPLIYLLARPWLAHRVTREVGRLNEAIAVAQLPWPERLKLTPEPMPRIAASRWRFLDSPAETIVYLQREHAAAFGRALATLRTAETAVAVERYRQAHQGGLPGQLGSLVPEFIERVPTDPFSGAQVVLKQFPDKYVVYSFGTNFKDDGGTSLKAPRTPATSNRDRPDLAPDLGVAVALDSGSGTTEVLSRR